MSLPSETYAWLALAVLLLYCVQALRYRAKLQQVTAHLHVAPISVRGGISQSLGGREAGLLLRAELDRSISSFATSRREAGSASASAALQMESATVLLGESSTSLPVASQLV